MDPAQSTQLTVTVVPVGATVILALPNNSELIAFKPSGKEYAELARIKVADTPSGPLVAGAIAPRDRRQEGLREGPGLADAVDDGMSGGS